LADRADVIDRRTLLGSALAATALPALAQTPDTIPWPPREGFRLWPGAPPGAEATLPRFDPEMRGDPGRRELQLRGVATPTVYVFRPAKPNGIGLLSAPGGGYEFLAASNEGLAPAAMFCAMGYTVFVLVYRLPAEGWQHRSDVPLQDAQRAMRLIRARARDYGIDPARIGVIGFSAGGHVAASLATAYEEPVYPIADAADRQPARPDFAGLIYAVTTLREPYTHQGSRDNLLGAAPSSGLVDRRSPSLHVDPRTPPSFALHALDDRVVPPECSIEWLAACRAHNRPVEAHFIQRGGHGFGVGLARSDPGADWPILFDRWIGGILG
jgi:acetyl esterase/lipase